jgi:hypothetical protein
MLIDSIFSKPIDQLTEYDISEYFAHPQIETDKIEFKSGKEFEETNEDTRKQEKTKDTFRKILTTICAFVNTDGGILIWGAPKGELLGKKEKEFTGDLIPVMEVFEKDQLISRISSLISPTPNKIKVQIIKAHAGGHIYIFEVLRSEFAPHQVNGTYYMRLDGQTRYAPHQYVEALMKKVNVPKLGMNFCFGESRAKKSEIIIPFAVHIYNQSNYIHDKNVTFRLISNGYIEKEDGFHSHKAEGTDIQYVAADIIHNSSSALKCFFLKVERDLNHSINIVAFLSGELSPMLTSMFHIDISYINPGKFNMTVLTKEDNIYLFERKEILGISNNESQTTKNYLEDYLHRNLENIMR